MAPPAPKYTPLSADPASTSDAEMLLGLQNSPYSHHTPSSVQSFDHKPSQGMASPGSTRADPSTTGSFDFTQSNSSMFSGSNSYLGMGGVGDMIMDSQEIDMSTLGGDMMPWYLPQDVLNFFDNGGNGITMSGGGSLNANVEMGNMGSNNG
jgi:hypothetical protein